MFGNYCLLLWFIICEMVYNTRNLRDGLKFTTAKRIRQNWNMAWA